VSGAPGRRAMPGDFHGLHVLVDDDPRWNVDPLRIAEAACRGGASVIQLRAKHATDTQILEWGRALRELTRGHDVRLVVNDRFDLALASEADAVHLGQDDLPPHRLPAPARQALAVGRSTHSLAQLKAALAEPVDYLAYGPVFETTSKEARYTKRGLDGLAEVAARMDARPLVAIGGIALENLEAVVAAGANAVAVISAVTAALDPEQATRDLVTRMAAGLLQRDDGGRRG